MRVTVRVLGYGYQPYAQCYYLRPWWPLPQKSSIGQQPRGYLEGSWFVLSLVLLKCLVVLIMSVHHLKDMSFIQVTPLRQQKELYSTLLHPPTPHTAHSSFKNVVNSCNVSPYLGCDSAYCWNTSYNCVCVCVCVWRDRIYRGKKQPS